MSDFRVVDCGTVESTNTCAKDAAADPDGLPVVYITDNQTAGRGQRGASWESEPGQNLTFSLVVRPRFIAAARQFELSMLVSTGILQGLRPFLPADRQPKIKWPNDIYVGDRKLAGILIENSLSRAAIERSVIGIGLNVNQLQFLSDAPNPVSIRRITGVENNLRDVLDSVVSAILDNIAAYESDPEIDELTFLYNSALWRNDGQPHKWHDTATDSDFVATLVDVAPDGTLTLRLADGLLRHYLFKQVSAVL